MASIFSRRAALLGSLLAAASIGGASLTSAPQLLRAPLAPADGTTTVKAPTAPTQQQAPVQKAAGSRFDGLYARTKGGNRVYGPRRGGTGTWVPAKAGGRLVYYHQRVGRA